MRILALSFVYPPTVNNGSITLHYLLKHLKRQGHEVKVMNRNMELRDSYSYEGINISGQSNDDLMFHWCDCVITQLYATNFAVAMCHKYDKPCVHLLHSNEKASYTSVLDGAPGRNYIVYNSENVKQDLHYQFPSIVINPMIEEEKFVMNDNPIFNQYVTLISLNDNKGSEIFYQLAERMPEYQFLGVMGHGSNQVIKPSHNITFMENTENVMEIYRKTRILLMPSKYESWGRTANEAMLCGIPVVCSHAKGLRENCGDIGIYCEDDYEQAIRRLDEDPFYYEVKSNDFKERMKQINLKEQLKQFEGFINQIR